MHSGKTTPHVLRYTHIVHAYRQGVPIQAIGKQTGLTSVRIAQIVADVPAPRTYAFQSPLGIERGALERARAVQRQRDATALAEKKAKRLHKQGGSSL